MTTLDNLKVLEKFNQTKVVDSISKLPEQIRRGWQEAKTVKLPRHYRKSRNIVFCGMGGSNLASELVRSVYQQEIGLPFILVRGYNLPGFVSRGSLVVICSYSGNTEETISCFKQALAQKAKIFCLATGGEIAVLAQKRRLPFYQINKKLNPSRQPRYAVGPQLGAVLSIFSRLKIIRIGEAEIDKAIEYLGALNKLFGPESSQTSNAVKKLAVQLQGSLPVIVAAEFLSANSHILNNQINESAKNLAQTYLIPELNHYLMDGLALPESVISQLKFLFLSSHLYSPAINQRFLVTQRALKKKKIKFVDYAVQGKSKLLAGLEVLLSGSWLSFYLAVLNEQEPTATPWVDYFKKELKNKIWYQYANNHR